MDDIHQSYLTKDIASLLNVEKIEAYGQLLKTLADQTGKIITYAELATTLGISMPTLKNYCWYEEETYILQRPDDLGLADQGSAVSQVDLV